MLRILSVWILLSGFLLIGAATLAAPADEQSDRQRVNAALADISSKQGLSLFVGHGLGRCVASGRGSEVCEWWMGKHDHGWASLSRAIHSRARLSLICELPLDGSPRGPDSCGAYPRKSNRSQWRLRKRQFRRASWKQKRTVTHPRHRAQRQLDSARTLASISHLVGAVPTGCSDSDPSQYVCFWKASNRTWGHGTLATVIQAAYSMKLRVRCSLPLDGSPREAHSCQVDIDD